MKRKVEYDGWTIEASPTILSKQRLFASGVAISRGDLYFFFHDLGNRVYRAQAYERGIEWAKQWILNINVHDGSLTIEAESMVPRAAEPGALACRSAGALLLAPLHRQRRLRYLAD
jgi:hypothetical protein